MKKCNDEGNHGILPSEWEELFRTTGVQFDALDQAKSQRARATRLGTFLAKNLGRVVPVEIGGRPAKAKLCASAAGKRQKRYYFQIQWEDEPRTGVSDHDPDPPDGQPESHPCGSSSQSRRRVKAARKKTKGQKTPKPKTRTVASARPSSGNTEDWS